MPPPRRKHPVRVRPTAVARVTPANPAPAAQPLADTLPLLDVFALRISALSKLRPDPTNEEQQELISLLQPILAESARLLALLNSPLPPDTDAERHAEHLTSLGIHTAYSLSQVHYLQAFALHTLSSLPPLSPVSDPSSLLALALQQYLKANESCEPYDPDLWDVVLYSDYARALIQDGRRLAEEAKEWEPMVSGIAKLVVGSIMPRVVAGMQTFDSLPDALPVSELGETYGSIRGMAMRAWEEYVSFVDEVEIAGSEEKRAEYLNDARAQVVELEALAEKRTLRWAGKTEAELLALEDLQGAAAGSEGEAAYTVELEEAEKGGNIGASVLCVDQVVADPFCARRAIDSGLFVSPPSL